MSEQRFCCTHGVFDYLPGDPDCQFEDGAGNDIEPEEES